MQAGLVAASAVYGAYAQNQAASAQMKLANKNADLLESQAEDALQRGELEVRAVRRRARALVGRQKAQAAGQGLDVSAGVVDDLTHETHAMGAVDMDRARQNSFDEAWGIRAQSSNQRLAGRYAYRSGRNAAVGTVLGGIGDSARAYYQFDRPQIQGAEED